RQPVVGVIVERTAIAAAAPVPAAAAAESTAASAAPKAATPRHPAAESAATAVRVRTVLSRQPDRVDHHVFFFRALHDVFQRAVHVTQVTRLIDAVGEHEDDAASLHVQQRGD